MIDIDNISFSYGEKGIFKNFSLKISKGENICFFGESGCGKTTLLRIILGLEKISGGNISGLNYQKPSVVFQEDRLLPFLSVIENICFIGADKEAAMYHLKALGIDDTADMLPEKLSGGMQRRVAIARALSVDFDILILDEAFTGLDEDNIITAVNHILKTAENKTIISVTHSKIIAELLNAKIIYL